MNLYPAIDLYQGKVVRLEQGDFNKCTVYSEDPVDMAQKLVGEGAQWLHVVDLEGAKTGIFANKTVLLAIRKTIHVKIQFGGGIRQISDIEKVFNLGIDRIVLGTKALDKTFLEAAFKKFGAARIAVGLDVRQNQVKTDGWTQNGNITLDAALDFFDQQGVQMLIYTDIEKDGVLKGPNWKKFSAVLRKTHARVILSGGISSLTDIEKALTVREPNFDGVIIGKALYERKFTLAHALTISS